MFRAVFGNKKGGGEKQVKHRKPAGKGNAVYMCNKTGISA